MKNIQESINRLDAALSQHDGMSNDVTMIPQPLRNRMIDRLLRKYIEGLTPIESDSLLLLHSRLKTLSVAERIKYKSGIQDRSEYIAVSAALWLLKHPQNMDKLMNYDKEKNNE